MAQARRNRRNKAPAWVWLLIGALLGFFFSHINFIEAYRFIEGSIEKKQKNHFPMVNQSRKEETNFDFYNILSERSSDSPTRKPTQSQAFAAANGKPHEKTVRSPETKGLPSDIPSKDANTPVSKKSYEMEERSAEALMNKAELVTVPVQPMKKHQLTDLDAVSQSRLALKKKEDVVNQEEKKNRPLSKIAGVSEKNNLLPSGLAVNKTDKIASSAALSKAGLQDKPSSSGFTLQIGYMQTYAAADRLKAQLLLIGFQGVKIQKVIKGNNIGFRVTVGNYTNRKQAEIDNNKLQKNKINGLIISK